MGRTPVALAAVALSLTLVPSALARIVDDGRTSDAVRLDTRGPEHVIAHVRRPVVVRSRPFGPVVARLGSATPFGSPSALGVVATRHGRWLAVTTPAVGNGRVGWIDARAGGLRYSRTPIRLVVDLSQRLLTMWTGARVVRRVSVGIGRPSSPTPVGRFAVTDKLAGPAYGAYYGCCILALSATQPRTPAGWTGGDRVAIHGTPTPSDFGRAVSAGCVHAPDDALRYLMRTVPLGTPVVVRG